jgi:MSHA biogenesis protein MshG
VPVYAYKGRNARGDLVQGRLEAQSAGAVADQLFNVGVFPVDIAPARDAGATALPAWAARFLPSPVGVVDVMLFSRQMHTLLKAGVPILRALTGIQESAHNRAFAAIVGDIRESLDSGRELSASLRRHPGAFSSFYVSMIRVGEMTGRLEETFLRLYQHLEYEKDMRERIRAALRYPLFVIVAMAVALAIVNLFVIPAFARVYQGFGAELPLLTRVLMAVSAFMVRYWLLLLIGGVLAALAWYFYLQSPDGRYRWDKAKLGIPVLGGIVLKASLARFAHSFAIAFRSGVPVVNALSVMARVVDNAFIGQRIEQMRDGIERGESVLRTAAAAGVFPPTVLQMIAVGEETGELDDLLSEVADMYEREVDYEVRTLSAQIEPVLIVLLGILVLVLALGVFLPLWDLAKVMIK